MWQMVADTRSITPSLQEQVVGSKLSSIKKLKPD
jgi:hypothetical protein